MSESKNKKTIGATERIKESKDDVKEENKKKRCFIITPIGGESSDIRRQIEGVIDECIIPVLGEEYDVIVAHRIFTTGSINNQVISEIYNDELVIANLTGLNPNVMYELAFRHALRKPVIVIKNKDDGYKLPFDITEDRTIFYTNDISGTAELKKSLKSFLDEIDLIKEADNPITRGIRNYEAVKFLEDTDNDSDKINVGTARLLFNQLNRIETKLQTVCDCNNLKTNTYKYVFDYVPQDTVLDYINEKKLTYDNWTMVLDKLEEYSNVSKSYEDKAKYKFIWNNLKSAIKESELSKEEKVILMNKCSLILRRL
jgi:hypothetical protein